MAKANSGIGGFFKEFWQRLKSPSPAFFKVIQKFLLFIISLGTLAVALQATNVLPEFVSRWTNYTLIAAAVAGWLLAKLPTVDKDRKVEDGELPFTAAKIAEGKEPIH